MEMQNSNCPCGRTKLYQICCGAIHNNKKEALTAEDLMRSRYVAFVKGDGAYLHKSHHSTKRPSNKESQEIEKWAKSVGWIKLEVFNTSKGLEKDTTGTVAFKAYFFENGKVEVINENSFFKKENNSWLYVGSI